MRLYLYVNRDGEKRVYFSVRKPQRGSQKNSREGGENSPGATGMEPCYRAQHTTLPTAPKDVATLSLKVLKDSESAARPVGRYLLHAKAVVCLVLPYPHPSYCVGFLLCVVCCVSPHPPSDERKWPGSEEMPQVKLEAY